MALTELGNTRTQRFVIGTALIGTALATIAFKVFTHDPFSVLDGLLLGGLGLGGYALIDPKLAKELLTTVLKRGRNGGA